MTLPADRHETMEYRARTQWLPGYLLVAGLIVVGAVGGLTLGGPLGQFMLAGLQTLPFALLALLAYLGAYQLWARVFAYIWLGILLLGLGGLAVLSVAGLLLARSGSISQPAAADPANLLAALAVPELGAAIVWTVGGLIAAGLVLLPAVRRLVARVLPLDPVSPVHAIALSIVVGTIIIGLGQLIATRGVPALLEMVNLNPDAVQSGSDAEQLLLIVYAFVWTVPGALIAAGFPVVRTVREALVRLGFVWPTGWQVGGAIVLALLMVGGASLLDAGIGRVWEAMGWPRTDSASFERLLGAAISPIGAVLIGITAGIGEEMVVRGALQPRLGILLSNLFFASLHAFQYGFDGVLSVFVIGFVLGIVRARTNTTTSSIVHGVYDFVLVMIIALGLFG